MQNIHYETLYRTESGHWWYKVRRKIIYNLIKRYRSNFGKDIKILDTGCGTGMLLKELEALGVCYGIDISQRAVDFCKQRGIGNILIADAANIPYPDNTFDVALALDVIEHIKDDEEALKEIYRVLKPQGMAIIMVPAFMFLWGVTDVISQHHRRYALSELRKKIENRRFSIIRSSYFNTFLFPFIALVRLMARWLNIPMKSENSEGKGLINYVLFLIFYVESILFRYINFPLRSFCDSNMQKINEHN